MLSFDFILQGSDATEKNALDAATHMDWAAVEVIHQPLKATHVHYIDTVKGVDVYYNWVADYYFFTPEEACT